MAAEQIEPDVDDEFEAEALDRGSGSLTHRDCLEIERWANEAHAELVAAANDGHERRPGMAWRAAWARANRSLPEDFGEEGDPVFSQRPSWADDALRAIFSAGPAPATRAPEILADAGLIVPREGVKAPLEGPAARVGNPADNAAPASRSPARRLSRRGTAAEGPSPRIVPTAARAPETPTETSPMSSTELSERALALLLERGPLPTREIAEALKADARETRLALMVEQRAGRAECVGLARAARWSATGVNGAAKPKAAAPADKAKAKPARKPPRSAATPRKANGHAVGLPWGITDAIEIPAAPCKRREHGEMVDAMLAQRAQLVTKFAEKVAAIDAAIRAFIE